MELSPTSIPRSGAPRTSSERGPALRFADAARRLGAAAHANGLAVPAFRCPPRSPGATRTIRRYPGGTVVSVRLRDRPFATVVADMVEGVLVANAVAPEDAPRLREALTAAASGDDGAVVGGHAAETAAAPVARAA